MPASAIIRYLRECHLADGRGAGLSDLFAAKVQHRSFLPSPEELLAGTLDPASVERDAYAAAAAEAALYRREKSLLYCAFPLVGRAAAGAGGDEGGADEGEAPLLCAPLLTFPARLYEEPAFPESLLALSLDRGAPQVNFRALAALVGDEGAAAELAARLLAALPEPPFGAAAAAELARVLEAEVPGLDASHLARFPELAGESQVRAAVRAAGSSGAACLSACALALVPLSVETRGVLHELAQIGGSEALSAPLRVLLGEPAPEQPEAVRAEPAVPAVLSQVQTAALRSARRHALTLLVGPPGTGKSFTVAAMALDHVARGEPVLIAARTEQALEVIAGKIEAQLGERAIILRGGRGETLLALKGTLELLLHGLLPPSTSSSDAPASFWERLASAAGPRGEVRTLLAELEEEIARREVLEREWGRQAHRPPPRSWWRRLWATRRQRRLAQRLARLPPPWQLLDRYESLLAERTWETRRLLQRAVRDRLERAVSDNRRELAGLLKALKARRSAEQEELFAGIDLSSLLQAFPLWMVSFADLHRVLPLVPEAFSVALVDEATQSDAASCLPALYRARRAVVTGDPRQLRHVSFLARERQRALGERHGLSAAQVEEFDYRGKSLLDLASAAVERRDQVFFLAEHFRSSPRIIAFSNREFYGGALRVMTRRPETERSRCLALRRVDGRRLPAGHNPQEAAALVADLAAWVEREAELPAGLSHSLGVLSPFREQVEHLGAEIRRRLPLAAIEKHRLLVGTPYAFQGEERDAMFLSLALDPDSPGGAFHYLERDDVFNVAVTRARGFQVVFCSLDLGDAPAGGRLARYLSHALAPPGPEPAPGPVARDRFLDEVRLELAARSFQVEEAYVVAGFTVDLVATRDGASLGIDLIGHPGAFADALDLERCRMLQRAGLPLFPLSYFAWRRDPEPCLAAIEDVVARAGGPGHAGGEIRRPAP